MSRYLFRMLTGAHIFEADCVCRDDWEAMNTAEDVLMDFTAIEVWDGKRFVVLIAKGDPKVTVPSRDMKGLSILV